MRCKSRYILVIFLITILLSSNVLPFLTHVSSIEQQYRILMDFYHGGWDGYSDYKTISELLSEEGYIVDKNMDKRLNEIDLSNYNALLLTYPCNDFSQDELNAIKNYVENGGGLLVTVDTQMFHGIEVPNQVAGLFGVHFYGDFVMICSIVDFNHPITMDKKQEDLFNPFLLWDAAIDKYPSNAIVLVKASSMLSNAPNGTSTTSSNIESSITDGIVAMIALNYGKGRAVFGPLNGLAQPWGTPWYRRDEPNKILLNTIKWLTTGFLLKEILDAEAKLYESSIKSIKEIQEDIGYMAGDVVEDLVLELGPDYVIGKLLPALLEKIKDIPLSDKEKDYIKWVIEKIENYLISGVDISDAIKELIKEKGTSYENAINATHVNFLSKPIIISQNANIYALCQDMLKISQTVETISESFTKPVKELYNLLKQAKETGGTVDLVLLIGGSGAVIIAFIIGGPVGAGFVLAALIKAHEAITVFEWGSTMMQAFWAISLITRVNDEKERIATIYTKEIDAAISSLEAGKLLIPLGQVEEIKAPPVFYLIGINEFSTLFRNTGLVETNARISAFILQYPIFVGGPYYSKGVTIAPNESKWITISIPYYVDVYSFLKTYILEMLFEPKIYVMITTEHGFAYERSVYSNTIIYEPAGVPYVWLLATSIPSGKSKTTVTLIVLNYGKMPINVTVSHEIPSELTSIDNVEFITPYTEITGSNVKWMLSLMPMEVRQIKYRIDVPSLETYQEIELPAPILTYLDPISGEEVQREGFKIRLVASDAVVSIIESTIPREVFVGDTFPLTVSIKNLGRLSASNVNIEICFPKGISLVSGEKSVSIKTLAPEHVYNVTWLVKAESPGNFTVMFHLTSDNAGSDILLAGITSLIPATIDFKPDTLNIKSKANESSVTVYIELPTNYDINDIDVTTIKLYTEKGFVSAQLSPISIGDYDNDGILDLMIKFPRQEIAKILNIGEKILIKVIGKVSGTLFEGMDIIKVLK